MEQALSEPEPISPPEIKATNQTRLTVVALLGVVAVLCVIETTRRMNIALPVPFLLLYGAGTLAAGIAGLRTALVTSTLIALFVVYSAFQDFGPDSLTGGLVPVLSGIAVSYFFGIFFGARRDKIVELTGSLRRSEANLTQARKTLADALMKTSDELQATSSQLYIERRLLDNAIQHSPAAIVVVTDDYRLAEFNPAAAALFELQESQDMQRDWSKLLQNVEILTEDGQRVLSDAGPITDALRFGTIVADSIFRIQAESGIVRWCSAYIAPIRQKNNSICGAIAIFVDITDKKKMRQRFDKLVQRIVIGHEKERQEVARVLYQNIGQRIAATRMSLQSILGAPDRDTDLREPIEQLESIVEAVRELAIQMRPDELDHLGLTAAIRWYLSKEQKRTGLKIRFESTADIPGVSDEISTACFRVVQEALNNAISHARASVIAVKLSEQNDDICLTVSDDGVGFEIDSVDNELPANAGFGLNSIRERVRLLGGELHIQSEPGKGTTISSAFPMHPDDDSGS